MIIDVMERFGIRTIYSIGTDGKYYGLYRSWYSNGKLSYEINYKNGKLHGLCRYLNLDGELITEKIFKDGIEQ